MPTDTFFRLPEEKRARILEGAWSEFTAVPYAEASINRIVQTSRIPRGSFYQYFEDKNDLFLTLIDEIRDQFLDLFHDTLERSGGDLFSMPLALLDAMVAPSGCITPAFSRAFALLSLNVNMDVQQLFFERAAGELLSAEAPRAHRPRAPALAGERLCGRRIHPARGSACLRHRPHAEKAGELRARARADARAH
ncbi:MAG: TetR/AcrR family transcriptional regulator [Oscillospiraceae bacterium]